MKYYKWLHDKIFALIPYGYDNFHTGWHLVLFNWWFRLGDKTLFNPKFQTNFSYLPEHSCFHFTRYWGNIQEQDETDENGTPLKYYYKIIDAPWQKDLYKKYTLKDGVWIKVDTKKLDSELDKDVFKTTFKFFEDGKRVPVKAELSAYKRHYGIYWFPKFLKPLFETVDKRVWIEFSTGIGKDRGSWKGGTTGLSYPFKKNLATTWLDFEYNELPKYLRGEQ